MNTPKLTPPYFAVVHISTPDTEQSYISVDIDNVTHVRLYATREAADKHAASNEKLRTTVLEITDLKPFALKVQNSNTKGEAFHIQRIDPTGSEWDSVPFSDILE